MNITLVGTKIVQDTKFLAFEKNNNVDVINITVDTNGEWTYKLDVRYPDKCCTGDAQYNIINLVKTDDIYTAVLTSDMLPFSGKYTMQIRAINGDKIQHSDTFDAWVKYSIEPGETYNPVPSEFYQIEANVTEINNHPPYPSDDGYWMIYNVNTHEYEKSEIPVIAKPGDGLPDIDITTDGKYLSNDGTKAIWADVEVEAKDAVLYTRQDLTDTQKQQARDNIGAGTSSFSGSYNDLTNKPDTYELPIASSSQLGGVKPDNKIDDMTQAVGVDNEGKLWSEPDIFIVNIRNAVSDKSSTEIFSAIYNGKVVYANDGGRIYPSIGGQGSILQRFAIVDDTGYISGYSIRGTAVTQFKNWVEVKSNKVNTISATSSDNQYPSAKCVWDALQEVGGGGETWELIKAITIADGAEESNALTIDTDESGAAFSLKKAKLYAIFPTYTGETTIPNYSFTMINGYTSGANKKSYSYTSAWVIPSNTSERSCSFDVDLTKPGLQSESVSRNKNSTGIEYFGPALIDSVTSIGGANMLIYPGCRFWLYGVRS